MFQKFWHDENGQGLVEYGLILGLIAVVVIAALLLMGPKVENQYNNVSNNI